MMVDLCISKLTTLNTCLLQSRDSKMKDKLQQERQPEPQVTEIKYPRHPLSLSLNQESRVQAAMEIGGFQLMQPNS